MTEGCQLTSEVFGTDNNKTIRVMSELGVNMLNGQPTTPPDQLFEGKRVCTKTLPFRNSPYSEPASTAHRPALLWRRVLRAQTLPSPSPLRKGLVMTSQGAVVTSDPPANLSESAGAEDKENSKVASEQCLSTPTKIHNPPTAITPVLERRLKLR